ncbi:lectin [Lysobacter aestuarii]|uniref:Lectin n=1 Tax=Marilutibacter aestuarii TaxID=1706195 RepID=A0A507ZXQ7_9GAMM|nr:lectin [Lysobacter aestuarii]
MPPATASALLPPPPRQGGIARLDGYGPLRVGMTAEEVEAAWDEDTPLGGAGAPTGGACYYLFPGTDAARAPVAFMIENDTFVRYDARSETLEAPGGGHIGDTADDIRQRHAGKVESRPHKYVEGGEYLRVTGVSGQPGVLVFVVDADGRVTGWHVGQAPQVDYVEGCS